MPEPPDPMPNNVTGVSPRVAEATSLSDERFRELADLYFEAVLGYSWEIQQHGSDITVESSDDIITIIAPGVGSYVLKSQASTQQIWLSSPLSGPKAYDWVSHGQRHGSRGGMTFGQWLNLRTGTNLATVLNTELGLEIEMLFG